jgi:uncharacterized Zn finger protein
MAPRRPAGRGGPPEGNWWPPPSKPIAVEGGLQARSRRGQIGETWWSQRFIAVLESFDIGSRLQSGKRYARTGQVISMEVGPGQVRASVQGSRAKPYRVFIETTVLTASEWDAIEAVMASSAIFTARLLADEMPEEIEEAFVDSSTSLFPESADELDSACSCPDWENPCKHIAAVFYLLAESFDEDPFLIFAWRGQGKAELLDGLRARRRGSVPSEGTDPGTVEGTEPGTVEGTEPVDSSEAADHGLFGWPLVDLERNDASLATEPAMFWGRDGDLAGIEIRPRLAVAPDLVLRRLDPSPLAADGTRIIEELRPLYQAITAGAAALTLGEAPEQTD